MMSNKDQRNQRPITSLSKGLSVGIAFAAPAAGAMLVSILVGLTETAVTDQSTSAILFAGRGLVSWFLGWRWYGLSGRGLRGKRPLYAGIGCAALGWTAYLLFRESFTGAVVSFVFFLLRGVL